MDLRDNREGLFMDTIKEIQLALDSTASYQEDHPAARAGCQC